MSSGLRLDFIPTARVGLHLHPADASTLARKCFLRLFGLGDEEATGAALLGWRLMAVRTASISVLAARGDSTGRDWFLPVQLMDQAAWWWGYRQHQLPLRTAIMAATASGAIITLDLRRRAADRARARPTAAP